jgi:para-aminobenzoate synthetase component 1
VTVRQGGGGSPQVLEGDPFRVLMRLLDRYRAPAPDGYPLPFAGGAVGYFSYDLRDSIEHIERRTTLDPQVPDFMLGFYDHALVFDHAEGVTYRVSRGEEPRELPEPADGAEQPVEPVRLASDFTAGEYVGAVQRAREYIADGDIFQVNLAQRFEGHCPSSGLAVYSRLRRVNPAAYAAYLAFDGLEVMSSSPEQFLLLEGDRVTTRPIKGTRPRRRDDPEFNERMAAELLGSGKDRAELAMIVDLERNDLGRTCSYGSVRVAEHAALEGHPTVFHLVSRVTGRLHRPEQDEMSLLRGAFPGGSITGAPKVRAMEIIEGLERHARGVYTGAIGYVSFHGRMDLNIAIRTLVRHRGRVYLHSGGGIVADSRPDFEHMETLHKARALFEALRASNFKELMEADSYGQA